MSSPAVQSRSRMPRIAEAAVERARLTVVPRRRVRAARMPFVALVTLVLLGGVVGLLLFNTSMQQASFAATALQDQATTLQARQLTLQMDLDALRAPQHVADQARRMGMVLPHNPLFLDLGTGKVQGTPFVSTPADGQPIWPAAPAKPPILTPRTTYVDPPATSLGDKSGSKAGDTSGTKSDTKSGNKSGNTAAGTTANATGGGRNDSSHTSTRNHTVHAHR